jgi:hypothetical protein
VPVDPLEAFGLFYKDNSGPVFRALLAGTLNRAAAEDATAEAFARALAHWDTVASHPNPKEVCSFQRHGLCSPEGQAAVTKKRVGQVMRLADALDATLGCGGDLLDGVGG